jgi:hypothetical protein
MTDTPPTTFAQKVGADIQQVEIRVENVLHTAIVKVEAGWTWVEGEFVYLDTEAKAAYNWVQKEDPQFAAYVRQTFLNWEQDAANTAQAAGGAIGQLIPKWGDSLGTVVDNVVQDLLGSSSAAPTAKAGVALLISQGEGLLLSMVKTKLAQALGALAGAAL